MNSYENVDTKTLRDRLTGMLIGLARATEGNDHLLTDSTAAVTLEALRTLDSEREALEEMLVRVDGEKRKLVPDCYLCAASCGRTDNYDMANLQKAPEEIRSLKLQILAEIRTLAQRAAKEPGLRTEELHMLLYRALFALGRDDWGPEELEPVLLAVEKME